MKNGKNSTSLGRGLEVSHLPAVAIVHADLPGVVVAVADPLLGFPGEMSLVALVVVWGHAPLAVSHHL